MQTDRVNRWLTLGANVGVLIGLILLIVELTQNRDMMRAQVRHELSMGIVELLALSANNDQLANVMRRAANGEELTVDELYQFNLRSNALFRYWEDVHYQYRQGLYDAVEYSKQKDAWEASVNNSKGLVTYWCQVRFLYLPEFMTELDSPMTMHSCELL